MGEGHRLIPIFCFGSIPSKGKCVVTCVLLLILCSVSCFCFFLSVSLQARSLCFFLISHQVASVRVSAYDALMEGSLRCNRKPCYEQISSLSPGSNQTQCENQRRFSLMRAFCNQSSPETEGRIGFGNNLLSAAGVDEDKPISQNLLNKAVLKDPRIMAEIIGLGLHESSTCKVKNCAPLLLLFFLFLSFHLFIVCHLLRPCLILRNVEKVFLQQAAEVLHMYVKDLTHNERCELLPGIPWMTCCAPLPEVGQVVNQVSLLVINSMASDWMGCKPHQKKHLIKPWLEFAYILRPLFSAKSSFRQRAAKQLLVALSDSCLQVNHVPWWFKGVDLLRLDNGEVTLAPIDESSSADPFKHCLCMKQNLHMPAAAGVNPTSHPSYDSPPNKDMSGHMQSLRGFLGIFKSASIGDHLRRTAVEQITNLLGEPLLQMALDSDVDLVHELVSELMISMKSEPCFHRGKYCGNTQKKPSTQGWHLYCKKGEFFSSTHVHQLALHF